MRAGATWRVLVPVLCALVGLVLLLLDPLPMQVLRNGLFDQYQRWQPRTYVPAPVRIVDIDDESLARFGQWPWPRTQIASLLEKLQAHGAAVVGFDVIFAEPDRTSPTAMVQQWGLQGSLASTLQKLPDHDAALAQAVAQGGVVLGVALQREPTAAGAGLPTRVAPYRFVNSGASSLGWLHSFGTELPVLPPLAQAAAGMGAISFLPDSDGVVRRVPMVLALNGAPFPSFAAETLRVAQGAKNYVLKSAEAQGSGLQEVRIGSVAVPTNAQGEVWVHYTDPVASRYIPAWKVLAGTVPVQEIEGNVILVGTSAQGLMDLRFSALGRVIPGVEAHAQVLEQILTGGGLQRPAWASAAEAIVLVLASLLVGFLAVTVRALVAALMSVGVIGLIAWGGWLGFAHAQLLLNAVTPALAVAFTFVLSSLTHHLATERQQRWVKEAFSRYVSPNLVQYLVSNPGQLELGGRRQECSFIFTDLAGFTSLMESIDPADAVSMLNAYLDEMIAIAFRHGGTLDRIVGDAVAIMFSAPVVQTDHRARALACALEMNTFATDYAAGIQAKGALFGKTRIGIHTGEVIVGNFGGSTMFDYRALGDPVNTAARLEGANKYLGTQMCVSAATVLGCPNVPVRPVGRLILKGKSKPLEVMEPVVAQDAALRAPLDEYRSAFAAMCVSGPQALPAFADLKQRYPQDPLVQLHTKRLQEGATDDLIVLSSK